MQKWAPVPSREARHLATVCRSELRLEAQCATADLLCAPLSLTEQSQQELPGEECLLQRTSRGLFLGAQLAACFPLSRTSLQFLLDLSFSWLALREFTTFCLIKLHPRFPVFNSLNKNVPFWRWIAQQCDCMWACTVKNG